MNRIGIICAMQTEMDILLNALGEGKKVKLFGITFYEGKIEDKDVVLSLCGVGKVNAAIGTTLLINEFNCDLIINSGIAGGISPLKKRDSVIATELGYHDFNVSAFGYPYGQVPQMPRFFQVNPGLLVLVKSIFNKVGLEYKTTRIYSGDLFVTSKEELSKIEDKEGFAVEMEGAAIAHVCVRSGIDFIVLRYISDIIGEENQEENYMEFEAEMSNRSAMVTLKLLQNMN